jgi:hypothetical protein
MRVYQISSRKFLLFLNTSFHLTQKITLVKKFFHVSLAAVAVALVLFSSCSKGPKGDTGATGAAGPAGPDNVFYSPWLTLTMTDSVEASFNNDTVAVQNVFAPAITQPILDSGLVLEYIEVLDNNGNTIEENAEANMECTLSLGAIYLNAPFDFSGFGFRYVAIPGSVLTTIESTSGLSATQIKNLPYAQASKLVANTTGQRTGN